MAEPDTKMPLEIVKAVRCDKCNKLHEATPENKDFVTIHGNINVGLSESLVENSLENGKVISVSVFCVDCFLQIIKKRFEAKAIR